MIFDTKWIISIEASVTLTIDWCLARKYDHDELQTLVGVFEVAEHWLNLVGACCVLAKRRLRSDRHSSVI